MAVPSLSWDSLGRPLESMCALGVGKEPRGTWGCPQAGGGEAGQAACLQRSRKPVGVRCDYCRAQGLFIIYDLELDRGPAQPCSECTFSSGRRGGGWAPRQENPEDSCEHGSVAYSVLWPGPATPPPRTQRLAPCLCAPHVPPGLTPSGWDVMPSLEPGLSRDDRPLFPS